MKKQIRNRAVPAAVILAAGKSERFGAPKVLQLFRGELFVTRIVSALAGAGIESIFLVLGHQAQQHMARLPKLSSVTFVINENYPFGQFSSVQAGLAALGPIPACGMFLCLIDQPHLQSQTFATLVQASQQQPQHIIIPTCQNRNGHPIYIPSWLFPTILAAPKTATLRQILNSNADRFAKIQVADAGILLDIDTPADLERLEKTDLHSGS